MTTSDETDVLASIGCVVRTKAPVIVALDHILRLLDALLDASVLWSLQQAAASGDIRLFNRTYHRESGIDQWLLEYKLCVAMQAAVQHSHMAIVERIHALHPHRLPVSLLQIAAKTGDLPLFQWLLMHRNDEICTPDVAHGDWTTESRAMLRCCVRHAYDGAVFAKQFQIVKWLLENGYTSCSQFALAGDAAAEAGDLETIKWLHSHSIPDVFSVRTIDKAAAQGHLEIVQFLLTNRSDGFSKTAEIEALIGGHDQVYEALQASGIVAKSLYNVSSFCYGARAAREGWLDLMQTERFLMSDAVSYKGAMDNACANGHIHVVEWLVDHYQIKCGQDSLRIAALRGRLHLLEWVHSQGCGEWGTGIMDGAAWHGHLDVIQWLHCNRQEGCTLNAMDYAARNGHLHVIQWLHENRTEGYSSTAMLAAAEKGNLPMLQWFHENSTTPWPQAVMDGAAQFNHHHVVEWLHANRTEGCSTRAMDLAAQHGHLEMVVWLHTHRSEGCSTSAMKSAKSTVAQWLHANRSEGSWGTLAMDHAAERGDLATLEFHRNNRVEGCSSDAAVAAASAGHLYIVQWLHKWYPDVFDGPRVATTANCEGEFHIVEWLQEQRLDKSDDKEEIASTLT